METWFKTTDIYSGTRLIKKVDAERVTDSSIYIGGRQRRPQTSHNCYFRTWEEARQHLIAKYRRAVELAHAHLRRAENDLGSAIALSPPRRIEFGCNYVEAK